jgi:hypothetical protein
MRTRHYRQRMQATSQCDATNVCRCIHFTTTEHVRYLLPADACRPTDLRDLLQVFNLRVHRYRQYVSQLYRACSCFDANPRSTQSMLAEVQNSTRIA